MSLLRLLLAVALGVLLARLLRRSFRAGEARRVRRRTGLDPKREVRTSWSEVADERKEGSDER